MSAAWYQTRSRTWWLVALFSFLALELVLRVKLGSIYVIAALWAMSHQAVDVKLGRTRTDALERFLFGLFAALLVSVFVFAVFTVLNVSFRSVENSWNWFQLP